VLRLPVQLRSQQAVLVDSCVVLAPAPALAPVLTTEREEKEKATVSVVENLERVATMAKVTEAPRSSAPQDGLLKILLSVPSSTTTPKKKALQSEQTIAFCFFPPCNSSSGSAKKLYLKAIVALTSTNFLVVSKENDPSPVILV
jgi:hypothetical protein